MQCKQPEFLNGVQLTSLVVAAFALLILSGCAQKEQAEKTPASPPNVSVDFKGPGNRVDASFQGLSPE